MAAYDLKDPYSIEKYKQLAFISKQLRYHQKMYKKFSDPDDMVKAYMYEQHLDNWLEDNLIKKAKQ